MHREYFYKDNRDYLLHQQVEIVEFEIKKSTAPTGSCDAQNASSQAGFILLCGDDPWRSVCDFCH